MERPIPYRGEEAYIFVSYAHKDSRKVWPIIERLQEDGFRVWYDDGIDPGTEWDENIAAHVADCGYFIAFLSENYLASNNCKDELNFSRDQGKPQLLIYLEDVVLPQGMAMRLGRNQAIFYNRYKAEEEFFAKLYEAQDIGAFNSNQQVPVLQSASRVTKQTVQIAKGKKALWPAAVAVVLVAAAVAAAFLFRPREERSENPTEDMAQTVGQLQPVTNTVLADNEQLKVTALDTALDDHYYTLSLAVENKGQGDLYLTTDNFYLNGVACKVDWRGTLTTGEASLVELSWKRETMESYGITADRVTVIEGELSGRYLDNSGEIDVCSVAYYPYGEENAVYVTYTPGETDTVLVDTEEFLVVASGSRQTEEGTWIQDFVCVNRTDQNVLFETTQECLNNNRLLNGLFSLSQWVYAGRTVYCSAAYSAPLWQTTGYDAVLQYSGKLDIYNLYNRKDQERELYAFELYPQGEQAAQVLTVRQPQPEQILTDNAYVQVAYLGSREYNDSNADMFWFRNLTEEQLTVDFSLHYEYEQDSVGIPCPLDPGQEGMALIYRSVDVDRSGMPAQVHLHVNDLAEELTVTIRNPAKES